MELSLAYLLIALGFGFLVGELFFPTGGILAICAVICAIAGIAVSFYVGDTATGFLTLAGVLIGGPLAFAGLLQISARTTWGKMLVQPGDDATLATLPANQELEPLRGRYGKALSDLRPAGVVDFDGRRVDVLSEGILVPAGAWVRCTDVKAGRVLVRRVEAPDLNRIDMSDVPT